MLRLGSNDRDVNPFRRTRVEDMKKPAESCRLCVMPGVGRAIGSSVEVFQRLGDVVEFVLDRVTRHMADARGNETAGRKDEERVEADACGFIREESLKPAPDRFAPRGEIDHIARIVIVRKREAGLIMILPCDLRANCFAAMANGEVDGVRQRRAFGEFNSRAVAGVVADDTIIHRLPSIEVDGCAVEHARPASFAPFIHFNRPHLPIVYHIGAPHTL